MYVHIYELSDILFLLSQPSLLITVLIYVVNYVSFSKGVARYSGTKLCHRVTDNCISSSSHFHRIPKLWNTFFLKLIYPFLEHNEEKLKTYLWNIILTLIIIVPYTL